VRVALVTCGAQGDVLPFTALAAALQARGHEATVWTHACFERMVRDAGLPFRELGGDPKPLIAAISATGRWNNLGLVGHMWSWVASWEEQQWARVSDACNGADVVVHHPMAGAVPWLATLAGRERFEVSLFPSSPTRAFAHPTFPFRHRVPAAFNAATYSARARLRRVLARSTLRKWRQRAGGDGLTPRSARARMYAFSPAVVSKPAEWSPREHVIGYLFRETRDWRPPPELDRFLSSGSAPVCVTLSSAMPERPEAVVEPLVEGILQAGRRALVLAGWGLRPPAARADVLFADQAPHDWVFPRVAAVIHHAGCGTTHAALRSGVPSVGLPLFSDQFFWAERLWRLGVSPPPLRTLRLSAAQVCETVAQLCDGVSIRDKTAALSQTVRRESPIDSALTLMGLPAAVSSAAS
jgi:sterol 3beta-glucosyltransferase